MQRQFSRVAAAFARAAGHPLMFALSCSLIVVWAATGPAFAFSDTWQLVINTGTTIVTFLMVFLIQNTQNRDSAAIQAKLDELIRVSKAENTFIGIDLLTQLEVEELRERCAQRANGKKDRPSQTNGQPRTYKRAE
jgi:low affinity Fe/Cu permease